MSTRSAEATIKGYYYQFDSTILNLLKLSNDSDTVVVEGIEDIDIKTATEETAIQCKYLSKPKFIPSAVRQPIMLMLDHFINPASSNSLKYILYAHFEEEVSGTEPKIDLAKIKEILTYKERKREIQYHVQKGITDAQLKKFLSQFKLSFGTEFLAQQKQVIGLLKATFKCNEFDADVHFYNNALRVILDLSIKKNVSQRTISKSDFIKQIDSRKRLFNDWFILLRTKNEYLKKSSQILKSTRTLLPSRAKMIVIGNDILGADNSKLPLASFIKNLIEKYYKLNSALSDAKPLTFVLDCDTKFLAQIKGELIDDEIQFNDGYEHIKFSSGVFNLEPIKTTNKGATKIVKSSFLLRILSKNTLVANLTSINAPGALIIFSKEDQPIKFATGQFFDFKYCEDLKDIYNLLEP